uniref:hypothetical protein n=1 Tax=Klebsiella pneumoniae TaxID=573 RepID=UPI001F4AF715
MPNRVLFPASKRILGLLYTSSPAEDLTPVIVGVRGTNNKKKLKEKKGKGREKKKRKGKRKEKKKG